MRPVTALLGRLRGQVGDLGASVVDRVVDWNARRQLDEQVRMLDEEVGALRGELNVLRAQRFTTLERRDALVARLLQREAQAVAALQAGHAALAREVAGVIVALQAERDAEQALLEANEAQSVALQAQVQTGENMLRRRRHELDLIRASEAVASAESAFAARAADGSAPVRTAIEAAGALRCRGGADDALPVTAQVPVDEDGALDRKLAAAGLAPVESPVDAVLARLQTQLALAPRAPKKTPPRSPRRTRKDTP